jgi:hypothetical protein
MIKCPACYGPTYNELEPPDWWWGEQCWLCHDEYKVSWLRWLYWCVLRAWWRVADPVLLAWHQWVWADTRVYVCRLHEDYWRGVRYLEYAEKTHLDEWRENWLRSIVRGEG